MSHLIILGDDFMFFVLTVHVGKPEPNHVCSHIQVIQAG